MKTGCERTMSTYGFPWPSMLDCSKFPLDNDMCIAAQSGRNSDRGRNNGNGDRSKGHRAEAGTKADGTAHRKSS